MSNWKTISKNNLELDGDEINVLIGTDDEGNNYVILKVADIEELLEPCSHENTEHHKSGDIHPRSLPYTECLDCGIEIDTEPLEPRDLAE